MILRLNIENIKKNPKAAKQISRTLLSIAFISFSLGLIFYFALSQAYDNHVKLSSKISTDLKASTITPELHKLINHELELGLLASSNYKLTFLLLFFSFGIVTLMYRSLVKKYIALIMSDQ
ncbi:MAG: hypothetical protein COA79_22740 [Planctomycetota bacterium]|nr:MAG: hypothetical protein COA79_22740 [Planctomycetota bacterium]